MLNGEALYKFDISKPLILYTETLISICVSLLYYS